MYNEKYAKREASKTANLIFLKKCLISKTGAIFIVALSPKGEWENHAAVYYNMNYLPRRLNHQVKENKS